MTSLRKKATSGVLWSALERLSQTGVVFAVQIVLARILGPEHFGLLAMVTVFVVISNVLVESGLGSAIVQRTDITDADLSTVFIFNLAAATLLAAVLWLAGPWVASFYNQPALAEVLAVLGLGLVLSSLGTVHRSILRKQLAFKKLFWISTPATLVSGLFGITLALQGFGVWALVGQTLSQKALGSICSWYQTRWLPKPVFDTSRFGVLFSYGSKLAVSGLLYQGFNNIYLLVIGRAFSPIDVGFFQRAKAMRELPITTLQSIVGSVTFPVLSSVQQDHALMRKILKRSLQLSALVAIPGMAVMAGLAEPLVLVLVGEKWLPCVPMLQLLCVSGALYPLHAGNLSLLQATGRSDLFLKVEVIKKLTTIANIVITYRYGLYAMIGGMIVTSLLALLTNTHYTKKIISYGSGEQMRDIGPSLGLGALLYATTACVGLLLDVAPATRLTVGLMIAGLVTVLAMRLMPEDIKGELRLWSARLPGGLQHAFGKLILA